MTQSLKVLMQQFSKPGKLVWIGVRSGHRQQVLSVESVIADTEQGLMGDRYQGRSGKRQVSLIQWEHLKVLEAFTGLAITPEMLRRNLVIEGINLLALQKQKFQIGDAVLQVTGLCHPCSRMEQVLGPGGYNAMRGHGGLTARVISDGEMSLGDAVIALPED